MARQQGAGVTRWQGNRGGVNKMARQHGAGLMLCTSPVQYGLYMNIRNGTVDTTYLPLLRRRYDTCFYHSISLLGIRFTRQLFLVSTTLGI